MGFLPGRQRSQQCRLPKNAQIAARSLCGSFSITCRTASRPNSRVPLLSPAPGCEHSAKRPRAASGRLPGAGSGGLQNVPKISGFRTLQFHQATSLFSGVFDPSFSRGFRNRPRSPRSLRPRIANAVCSTERRSHRGSPEHRISRSRLSRSTRRGRWTLASPEGADREIVAGEVL
jgi:hypothetical protein